MEFTTKEGFFETGTDYLQDSSLDLY